MTRALAHIGVHILHSTNWPINDEENEEEDDDVYMYLADMNLDERVDYRAACRASKASEWNR